MRNKRLGEFRPTSALSARAVEIASEIGGVNHLRCGLRAREGRGEPLNSARAVEMASEIGGVTHTVWRRRGGEGCGAHRRDRTDLHQPPVRRGERAACAGCRQFPVGHWVSG